MKFIKYITPALFCAALTLQSCEHFLDTKPMESYSEDLVWSLNRQRTLLYCKPTTMSSPSITISARRSNGP